MANGQFRNLVIFLDILWWSKNRDGFWTGQKPSLLSTHNSYGRLIGIHMRSIEWRYFQ